MKGDFTRATFEREKHYSSVRWQQGRVQTDADWNEQVDILAHLDRTTHRDIIGLCGGPQGTDGEGRDLAGFLVDGDGELEITSGRYYVDGILVENEEEVSFTNQPGFPNTSLPTEAGSYLAYLDVWERHITALEDDEIREVALGGPDTTTRTKVVWQVKLLRLGDAESGDCSTESDEWTRLITGSTGRLSAQAELEETDIGPCVVPERAGYRGLENQLYRVEVHRVVAEDDITLKWSRENGSVVFPWLKEKWNSSEPNKLTLQSTGRDSALGLAPGNWVELTDDGRELRGEPGLLVNVQGVNGNVITIDPGTAPTDLADDLADFEGNPKVRRWDMARDIGEVTIDPTVADNWIPLENGVEIKLEPGSYRTGDYWMIPARTATRDIEWPRDDADDPLPQPPHGIQHHYCRLAILDFDSETWSRRSDCRRLFPPLTEMLRFFHVGGDGQEALPGQPLPRPLQVGVANGQSPVEGAQVQFRIVDGNGRLQATGVGPAQRIVVGTDANGIAECRWRLDDDTDSQVVEATLLEIDGKPLVDGAGTSLLTPIRFNANLSVARQVAYDPAACSNLSEATTVQEAIDILCQIQPGGGCCTTVGEGGEHESIAEALENLIEQGQTDICICLLPGDHVLGGFELGFSVDDPEHHIEIAGCGLGSRVFLQDRLRFIGLQSLTLRDAALELLFPVEGEEGAITLDRCSEVTLTSCHINGLTAGEADGEPQGVLMSITNADRVSLRDNVLEAGLLGSLDLASEVFEQANVGSLAELFSLPGQGVFDSREFKLRALESAQELSELNRNQRQQLQRAINTALSRLREENGLSEGENFSFQKLNFELGVARPALEDLYDVLLDIRRAAIKSHPGVALVLGSELDLVPPEDIELIAIDEDDYATLVSNEIIGILSLYGMPPPIDSIREDFDPNILGQLEELVRGGEISLRDGAGFLGTLQLRGNQVVRIAVGRHIFDWLLDILTGEVEDEFLALFDRCLISDNVIEGGNNWAVCIHQSMTSNDFTMTAAQFRGEIGFVVSDSAVYLGNHSGDPDWVLRDISRTSSQAANLELAIG